MSIGIAHELNYLENLEEDLEEELYRRVQEGEEQVVNRRRRNGGPPQQSLPVHNKDTKRLVDSLTSFRNRLTQLQELMDSLVRVSRQIEEKQAVLNQIAEQRKKDAVKKPTKEERSESIKRKVDFREIDKILDDIVDEALNSVFFSTVNLAMVVVMAVCAFLWFKLHNANKF